LRLSSLEDVVGIIDEVVLVVIYKRLNCCGGASVVGQDGAIDDGRALEVECAENHLVSLRVEGRTVEKGGNGLMVFYVDSCEYKPSARSVCPHLTTVHCSFDDSKSVEERIEG